MRTYEDAIRFIDQTQKYGNHPGSENAAYLLDILNHPESSLKIIHVAGTNGKGSVCAFLADMLTACGYQTGLFTSPHLVDIRERIQIDREKISQEDFLFDFEKTADAAQKLAANGYGAITYFDYIFAIAMCYFARRGTEYVVMETGLGGLYDSTNAVSHPILTIITSISLDHTEQLGGTTAEIAVQKAGILKSGVPLIYSADEPDACAIFKKEALHKNIPCLGVGRKDCTFLKFEAGKLSFKLHLEKFSSSLTVNSPAVYQMENGAIAWLAALVLLGFRNGRSKQILTFPNIYPSFDWISDTQMQVLKSALAHSVWEGRFEQAAPFVYLDGAHNADGIRMLLASLRLLPAHPATLLFAAAKEKDTEKMIEEICGSGLFNRYILTALNGPRAIPVQQLKTKFEKYTKMPIICHSSLEQAIPYALCSRQENEILLAAGSLYLVGAVKSILEKKANNIQADRGDSCEN